MTRYTELTRENIYHDTKKWYAEADGGGGFSKELIKFCQEYAGKKILDYGCATGDYCVELNRLGFETTGVDINREYIELARKKGVAAWVVDGKLPFEDKYFDTVIMFELLEHVPDVDIILREARRVAKKNILITVPDCGAFKMLERYRLTYKHFLDNDHINFFTKKEMEDLLAKYFTKFRVEEREPLFVGTAGLPWLLRKFIGLLYKLRIIKPVVYYRIYAVVDLE